MTLDKVSDRLRVTVRGGLSLIAILAVVGAAVVPAATMLIPGTAQAQDESGHEGGGGQGGNGPGPGGSGTGGHEGGNSGGHDDGEGGGGHEGGTGGQGQGGPGGESEGQGPRAGQGHTSGGSRPPWASEGIPEDVELGRLNVARSPDRVLDRAYGEVLLTMAATAGFYNLSLAEMINQMSTNWEGIMIVDSPLQNLALYRDALDGSIDLSAYGIANDRETLMAAFLGVASDKEEPITTGTVLALSVIFEMPMSPAEAASLAAQAEAIRLADALGHG